MSIVIKGMEMPESCYDCRMRTPLDFCKAMPPEFAGYTDDNKKPDWCPLVELPAKHGRLIDAEELFLPAEEMISRMAVHHAPTIIEAEGNDI